MARMLNRQSSMASGLVSSTTPAVLTRSHTLSHIGRPTTGVAAEAAEAFDDKKELDFEAFCELVCIASRAHVRADRVACIPP